MTVRHDDNVEVSAGIIMKPEEQQAMEHANNLYGGVAKVNAANFVTALGLGLESSTQALLRIGAALDSSDDFMQKKEAAGHFKALVELLVGQQSVGATVEVDQPPAVTVPVQIAPTELQSNGHSANGNGSSTSTHEAEHRPERVSSDDKDFVDSGDSTSEPGEADEVVSERTVVIDDHEQGFSAASVLERFNITPEIPSSNKFRTPYFNFLSKLFGFKEGISSESLTVEEVLSAGEVLAQRYIDLRIVRLNHEAKVARATQMLLKLAGMNDVKIGELTSASRASVWIGLNKMTESIVKRISADELRMIWDNRSAVNPELSTPETQMDTTDSTEDETQDSRESIDTANEHEEQNLKAVISKLADCLHYTLRPQVRALEDIFNVSGGKALNSEVIETARDDLLVVMQIVQKDSHLSAFEKLDEFEERVMDTILGRNGKPIDVWAIAKRETAALNELGLDIEDVLKAALTKIINARTAKR